MKECESFKILYDKIKSLGSKDIKRINIGYADGHILKYYFRIFQEAIEMDENNEYKYQAYVLINDESSKGSIWPAFYDVKSLDKWYKNKVKLIMKK